MRRAPALLLAGALALALAGPSGADTAAMPAVPTAEELRASMQQSDSILIAHVEVDVVEVRDSSGQTKQEWHNRRLFVNQVKGPWMKRFAAAFLPEGTSTRDRLCPAPQAFAGAAKPWMLTALWINPDGRGQAYVDLANHCAIAGLAGRTPAGLDVPAAAAESLFALFRQGLFADTVLAAMSFESLRTAPATSPDSGAADASGRLRVEDNVGVATPPEPLQKVAPAYPKRAREANVEGMVMVIALVDTTGHVAQAQVQSGVAMLDVAALNAVRKWTFKPARGADGRPVAARVLVPVQFSLQAEAPTPRR